MGNTSKKEKNDRVQNIGSEEVTNKVKSTILLILHTYPTRVF